MANVSDIDKSWLAGIVDGEGCIGAYRDKRSDSVRFKFTIYNCNPIVVRESQRIIEALLGESIRPRLCHGQKRDHTYKGRPGWLVGVYTRHRVHLLLDELLPFLRGKRHEAEVALETLALCPDRRSGKWRWHGKVPLPKHVDVLLSELSNAKFCNRFVGNAEPSGAGASGSAEGATVRAVTPQE